MTTSLRRPKRYRIASPENRVKILGAPERHAIRVGTTVRFAIHFVSDLEDRELAEMVGRVVETRGTAFPRLITVDWNDGHGPTRSTEEILAVATRDDANLGDQAATGGPAPASPQAPARGPAEGGARTRRRRLSRRAPADVAALGRGAVPPLDRPPAQRRGLRHPPRQSVGEHVGLARHGPESRRRPGRPDPAGPAADGEGGRPQATPAGEHRRPLSRRDPVDLVPPGRGADLPRDRRAAQRQGPRQPLRQAVEHHACLARPRAQSRGSPGYRDAPWRRSWGEE